MVKDYTSRPAKIVFQCLICFTCPLLLSNAAIPQWPVGSNGCNSLAGWEYQTWCIYQERIICPEITHQVPLTWFSMLNVPFRPIQPTFLSGRLGVMAVPHLMVGSLPPRQTSGLNYMVKYYTSGPRDGSKCLMCFMYPILPPNASIPQWPFGSNGGVPHWPVESITHDAYVKKGLFVPK